MEQLPKRNEISDALKWRLEDMYKSEEAWEADFQNVKKISSKLKKYKGRLGDSPETLYNTLEMFSKLFATVEMVYCYARMRKDEDNGDSKRQALADRASVLITEISADCSFIDPEIINLPMEIIKRFLKYDKKHKTYEHYIKDLIRQKKHILSRNEEEILALAGEATSAPRDVYTMFNNADIKFDPIKDENGKEIELTKGRYSLMMENRDRRIRHDAFKSLYRSYGAVRNTLATNYNASIKTNRFYSRVRKYPTCLQAALDRNMIEPAVYNNLIETTHRNLHLLHRYLSVRKKILWLDELHPYDLYVPIIDLPERKISYDEAKKMVIDGLTPLGTRYLTDMENGMNSGWIDVSESQGKTGGAYSWGAYNSHPYVLLNHQDNINSVFTLAHEMGHAMHTFYTNQAQHFINSEYPIFLAEVASTVNESLLMQNLLKVANNKLEKSWLLNHYLEEFRGTIFRQVMFAEFEKLTHEEIEQGGVLTADYLCQLYRGLNEKYFGSELVIDEELNIEWARIPHFYRNFYVYQYATGFSAAESLSRMILDEGIPAVGRYLKFLSSGRSDYPLNLLKEAGVDLTDPLTVQDAFDAFNNILKQMEELI